MTEPATVAATGLVLADLWVWVAWGLGTGLVLGAFKSVFKRL